VGLLLFLGPALGKGVSRVELNQRKLLSLKSWKALAEKGEAPKDAVFLVSVDIPDAKQLDENGNVYRFVISTSTPRPRQRCHQGRPRRDGAPVLNPGKVVNY
jgi:hypothetical protein